MLKKCFVETFGRPRYGKIVLDSTEVPELQDVVGPKSMAPPLTAQTAGPNWLKFFVEAPQEDTFRGIEGIFEFRLRS